MVQDHYSCPIVFTREREMGRDRPLEVVRKCTAQGEATESVASLLAHHFYVINSLHAPPSQARSAIRAQRACRRVE